MQYKNRFEFIVFILLVKIFNLFGIKKAKIIAYFLAFIFYYLIPVRKATVFSNLKSAFPDYSNKEIKKLAFKNYYSISIAFAEIFCLPYIKSSQLSSMVFCDEIDIIKNKYKLNKGLIFLTAHFGNWELGAVWMGLQLGIPVHVVAKTQRNDLVSNWLDKMRQRFGNKVITLGLSIRNIYKELSNKNIIGIVGDQRGSQDGVRVKFFGHNTAVYPGTAALALKTCAPIVVVLIVRQKDFKYKACVETIETDTLSGDEQTKIIEINQRYMNILEKYIREYPEQWFWMHKIWKY